MLCITSEAARAEGLTGSFAMIRLADQAIVVDLVEVAACGVQDFAVEVLAHEIGHHVLAPATLTDHARMLARMRHSLPTVERHAPMVANLYTDLLINDRLQRSVGLRLSAIYQALARRGDEPGPLWTLYLRTYELMWRLERGSLGSGRADDRVEGDAWLAARLVRSYARDPLGGSGRFAALLLTYLLEDEASLRLVVPLLDTAAAGQGGDPSGLTEEEPGERDGAIHPALDPELTGDAPAEEPDDDAATPREMPANTQPRGQARQPFEFGEILKAAGVQLTPQEAAVRYYRERARAHRVRFPSRRIPESPEPLPEGLEPWSLGDPMDAADWIQTVLLSPHVVPGLTTVQRVWGTTEAAEPRRVPVDLDIYVDCSGSMPNPAQLISYPALAGAIVCLSALRAGARVQATLWSGKHQVVTTGGFVRDEMQVLRVLTDYLGGGTQFPIHVLRDTYLGKARRDRPAHILVVSDDGVTTMFDDDERGHSGWEISADVLRAAGAGGTLVLNLSDWWLEHQAGPNADLRRAAAEGWNVHRVATMEDLVGFAREFSRRAYGEEQRAEGSETRG